MELLLHADPRFGGESDSDEKDRRTALHMARIRLQKNTCPNLRREDFDVNEKKVERLWSILGFMSILPRPNLSNAAISHPCYPYLLNGLWIGEPNQVFSTDITFLPLANGFVYLATVTDWFSRYVLAKELSKTMTADFCLEVLKKALQIARPEYFNTDQGSQ